MSSYAHDPIVPFKQSTHSKKQQVAEMFDRIAFRYDFLNRFLSVGIDVWWRKKTIEQLRDLNPQHILDVATGTGDVAILTHKMLHPKKITGVDISEGMLQIGRRKIEKQSLQNEIELFKADSENLPFDKLSFDAITVAFGVRNFQNLEKGVAEMYRVLQTNGRLVVLEFSRPSNIFVKGIYNVYMKRIAPAFSKLFGSNKEAYQYLNTSVQAFPEKKNFINILKNAGFASAYYHPLTFGICTVYVADK